MINQTKLVAALGAVALTAAVTLTSVAAAGRDAATRGWRPRRVLASMPTSFPSGMPSRRPRPSCSGRRLTASPAGSRWSRVRCTTRSTRSTAATSRTSSTHEFEPGHGLESAAAATAAYRVLLAITLDARHANLDTLYASTMATIPKKVPSKQEGVDAGEAAADAMLDDREKVTVSWRRSHPVIGTDPGDWRPIGWPAAPVLRPGRMGRLSEAVPDREPSQFRSEGPNALTSRAYADDFAEVEELGALNSATRTGRPDESRRLLAVRPNPRSGTRSPGTLADRYGLDAADQARLYAMVNLAGADGAISCWNDKYYWNFWRPRAAIRKATRRQPGNDRRSELGVAVRAGDTDDTAVLATPPFPDHPSGHGCSSGAVLNTFADFFGTDKVAVRLVSGRSLNGVPIPPRAFDRFSQALRRSSTRASGRHPLRTADVQGAVIGKKVAHWLSQALLPARGVGDVWAEAAAAARGLLACPITWFR